MQPDDLRDRSGTASLVLMTGALIGMVVVVALALPC
jgi:hypothetical protein